MSDYDVEQGEQQPQILPPQIVPFETYRPDAAISDACSLGSACSKIITGVAATGGGFGGLIAGSLLSSMFNPDKGAAFAFGGAVVGALVGASCVSNSAGDTRQSRPSHRDRLQERRIQRRLDQYVSDPDQGYGR